jgi:hypothetical protein
MGPVYIEHDVASYCGSRDGLQIFRAAENILNKQFLTNEKEWSSSFKGWAWNYQPLAAKEVPSYEMC